MATAQGGSPLSDAEREALLLLTRVYEVAVARNATKYLPQWMDKYRPRSRTAHAVGREPEVFLPDEATTTDAVVVQRRNVLRAALLISHPKEVQASTDTPGVLQLVRVYEHAHDTGMQALQRLAGTWMLESLRQHARAQADLLLRASSQRVALQWAAKFVDERVATQLAARSGDLDRVLFPRNRRRRDGDLKQRVRRVQYILAVRAVLDQVLSTPAAMPARLERQQESRGLTPPLLNRQTERSVTAVPIPRDPALIAALQFLDRLKWHPQFEAIVSGWRSEWSGGFERLATAVGEALKANADLTKRLDDEPSRVWAFRAALQQAIGALAVPGTRAVMLYAFAYAPTVKTPLEEALETIGVITTLLATFGGPAAPIGIIADAIVQSGSAAVSFLRQMDQDDAEAATAFEKDADRLSEGGRYFGPVVQAVGALAVAAAVPHAVKDILSVRVPAARVPSRTGAIEPRMPSSSEVNQARKDLAAQLETLAKDAGFMTPTYQALQMTPQQVDVFAGVNGRMLKSTPRAVPSGLQAARTTELVAAQNRAQNLLDRLAEHWSAARPGLGKQKLTAEQAAKELLEQLTSSPPATGTVNQEVRAALYDRWRSRFINSVKNDPALIADLNDWAGVVFTPPGSKVTAFRVQALDNSGAVQWVDLNWDHAFRHDDAVARAVRTGDPSHLVSTVDPKNLGANLARENQVFKEGLIRHEEALRSGVLPPRAAATGDVTAYETLVDP